MGRAHSHVKRKGGTGAQYAVPFPSLTLGRAKFGGTGVHSGPS